MQAAWLQRAHFHAVQYVTTSHSQVRGHQGPMHMSGGRACPGASTQGCHWPHKEEPSSLWAPWHHCLLVSLAALGTTAQDQGCPRVTPPPGVTSTGSGSTALLSPATAREDCSGPRGTHIYRAPTACLPLTECLGQLLMAPSYRCRN